MLTYENVFKNSRQEPVSRVLALMALPNRPMRDPANDSATAPRREGAIGDATVVGVFIEKRTRVVDYPPRSLNANRVNHCVLAKRGLIERTDREHGDQAF